MHEPITTSSIIFHGMLAIFGAITHATRAHRLGEAKTMLDFLTLTVMSSFSGAMFALAGFHFFADEIYLTMAMAGTGGFLGVEGMAIIIERIREIIRKK